MKLSISVKPSDAIGQTLSPTFLLNNVSQSERLAQQKRRPNGHVTELRQTNVDKSQSLKLSNSRIDCTLRQPSWTDVVCILRERLLLHIWFPSPFYLLPPFPPDSHFFADSLTFNGITADVRLLPCRNTVILAVAVAMEKFHFLPHAISRIVHSLLPPPPPPAFTSTPAASKSRKTLHRFGVISSPRASQGAHHGFRAEYIENP